MVKIISSNGAYLIKGREWLMNEKILVICEIPAPYRVEMCKALRRRWELRVYFEMFQDEKRESNWLAHNDIECMVLETKEGRGAFWQDIRDIKQFSLVILYNNCMKFSVIVEFLCKINKIPYIINCDGCNDIEEKNIFKHMLKNQLMHGACYYFAGGQTAKKYFEYYGAEKERILIHHFTSLYHKDILKNPLGKKEKEELKYKLGFIEQFCVISVGRYIGCKGFDILLRAAKALPDIGFYLIGGIPSADAEEYRQKNKLKNVHFINFMKKDLLMKYYQASDLFVLMTRGDAWGLVVNEAMDNGIPVITTKRCVAGVELVADGETGYIINVDDKDALIEKILMMEKNEENLYRMGMKCIDKIADYTYEKMIEIQLRAINRCLRD